MAYLSRWVPILVAVLACFVGASRALELDGVPQCAVTCLLDNLKETSCLQTDTQCLCDDQFYMDLSVECVAANCTVKDALTTKNITSTACSDPIRDQDQSINLSRAVSLSSKTAFFLVRFLVKMAGVGPGWGWDDYTVITAFLVSIGMTATSFLEQQHGEGRDIWTLPFSEVNKFLKFFLIFEFLYVVAIGLIKSSLIFYYLRHFQGSSVRLALQLTQMFNFFVIVAFGAATMLQCQPLSYFWNGWDEYNIAEFKSGSCFNMNAFTHAHAGINVGLSVWLMIIPLTQFTWMKNLHGSQKAGVTFMYGLAIILTVMGIMRLKALWYIENSINMTRDYFGVIFWSSLQVSGAIVLLCLPATRLLLVDVIFSSCGSRKRSSSSCSRYRDATEMGFDDNKKLISKPIGNRTPLPEDHDWGFGKKHGYYDSTYSDWDERVHIDWKGGPRDWNPKTGAVAAAVTTTPIATLSPVSPPSYFSPKIAEEHGSAIYYNQYPNPLQHHPFHQQEKGNRPQDININLVPPPTPPLATATPLALGTNHSARHSPVLEQHYGNPFDGVDRTMLCPPSAPQSHGWRETLNSWKEKRDTSASRLTRNTWRSTLGIGARTGDRRETTTSRIGEIKIMIDRAILRPLSSVGGNNGQQHQHQHQQQQQSMRTSLGPSPLGLPPHGPGPGHGGEHGNGGWI